MNSETQVLRQAVDWHALHHAYGAADDMPQLLRDLASPDAAVVEATVHELFGNIWHQGTVYEATAPAVPFLIEAARSLAALHRAELLHLLGAIATGASYLDIHQHLPSFNDCRDTLEHATQLARELGWVADAYAAVRKGVPVFLPMLTDVSSDVRGAAAYVLAQFSENRDRIYPALARQMREETDESARINLLLGCALTGSEATTTQATQQALHAALDDPDETVRFAATIAAVRCFGAAAPPDAVALLRTFEDDPASVAVAEDLDWSLDALVACTRVSPNAFGG